MTSYPELGIVLVSPYAVVPRKAHETDSCYDLSLIGIKERLGNDITVFHTGIKMIIPDGYHVKIHPRSSLHKYGYTLANCTGIIDQDYRGEILVALHKYDPMLLDLTLPFRAVQFIMEKKTLYSLNVQTEDGESLLLEVPLPPKDKGKTRGANGFGSSGH